MPLNIFETQPLGGITLGQDENLGGTGALHIQCIELYDSILWNTVCMVKSQNTADTASISIGLYSLTGSTLSLVNQATNTITGNGASWVSLVTSATSNLTPGNWWLAYLVYKTGGNNYSWWCNQMTAGINDGVIVPRHIRGVYSTVTSVLPSTIHTSQIRGEAAAISGDNSTFQPYILISA